MHRTRITRALTKHLPSQKSLLLRSISSPPPPTISCIHHLQQQHNRHYHHHVNTTTVDLHFRKISPSLESNESSSSSSPTTTTTTTLPPLVIIHGLFGSSMNFYTFSRQQSREWNRDCYLIDLRNHGSSGHDDYDMSITSMAHDLEQFLNEQQIDECDLLGFSLGGKVSMAACLNPHLSVRNRVSRLIVGDIAPVAYREGQWDIPSVMNALQALNDQLPHIQKRSDADEVLKRQGIDSSAVRSFLLSNLDYQQQQQQQQSSSSNFYWKFNLRGLLNGLNDIADFPYNTTTTTSTTTNTTTHDTSNSYAPFEKPTMFIIGEKSRLLEMKSPEVQSTVQSFFPQAQHTVFENCGHWVHTENPALFKKTVEQFLNRQE